MGNHFKSGLLLNVFYSLNLVAIGLYMDTKQLIAPSWALIRIQKSSSGHLLVTRKASWVSNLILPWVLFSKVLQLPWERLNVVVEFII